MNIKNSLALGAMFLVGVAADNQKQHTPNTDNLTMNVLTLSVIIFAGFLLKFPNAVDRVVDELDRNMPSLNEERAVLARRRVEILAQTRVLEEGLEGLIRQRVAQQDNLNRDLPGEALDRFFIEGRALINNQQRLGEDIDAIKDELQMLGQQVEVVNDLEQRRGRHLDLEMKRQEAEAHRLNNAALNSVSNRTR